MIRPRSFLVLVLAAASLGMTQQDSGGPHSPITARTGPNGFPTGPRGFGSFQGYGSGIRVSFQDGRLRLLPSPGTGEGIGVEDLRLELPAMIDAHDEGAIAATAEIVAYRNSLASPRSSETRSPAPARGDVAGSGRALPPNPQTSLHPGPPRGRSRQCLRGAGDAPGSFSDVQAPQGLTESAGIRVCFPG